jgi:2-methylisocitrate lyase-like PEP mutase family enzyme
MTSCGSDARIAGCYDALSAILLSRSGHHAGFVSGYAVSDPGGLPDHLCMIFKITRQYLNMCIGFCYHAWRA